MKRLGLVLCLFLGGCASATTEYYEAVTAAAKANAVASQAKFDALSAIAAALDRDWETNTTPNPVFSCSTPNNK